MIDFDGTDLIGLESGTNGFTIDPESGFEFGLTPDTLTWAERRIGGVPVGKPKRPNMETELPMICAGVDEDSVLEEIGRLRETCEKVQAQSGLGGTEIGWQKLGATYESTLICYSAQIGKVKIGVDDKRMTVARFALTLICAPYILGPEYTAASGTKPAGVPAADITIADARGDLPGPARIVVTNQGTVAQQFALLGIQWRQAVSGNDMLLPASTFDVSTSPLNGTYSVGTNEVQTVTITGTPTGGTFTLTFEGQTTAAIAYNAGQAAIVAALEALSTIGTGDVSVGGTPLPGTAAIVTFQGDLAGRNLSQMTAAGSFTGGATPAVSVATTTPGVEGYVSTPVYSGWTSFARTAAQTDVGDYDLWARVYDAGSTADKVLVRAIISVGDTAAGNDNRSVLVPATGAAIWVNLGPVHANPQGVGTHKWTATVQAKTLGTEGTTLRVLDVLKVPTEHGRALVKVTRSDQSAMSMRDNFGATSGALTADTSTSGHVWASMGGLTDADDFQAATGDAIERTATSDTVTDIRYGRGVVLGTATATDVDVSVDVETSFVGDFDDWSGVFAHFTDNDNFAAAVRSALGEVRLYKVASGTPTLIASVPVNGATVKQRLALRIYASGAWIVTFADAAVLTGVASAFASGTLASGKSGLIDWNPYGEVKTRTYSNFTVAIPTPEEAAIYPARKLQWSDDGGLHREASAGTDYSYAQGQQGTGAPLLGPEGAETLTNRLVIASADQNPTYAATGNQCPRLDWIAYARPAFAIGRHTN